MDKLALHLLCWTVTGMLGVEEQRFNVGMICLSVDAIYNIIIHNTHFVRLHVHVRTRATYNCIHVSLPITSNGLLAQRVTRTCTSVYLF